MVLVAPCRTGPGISISHSDQLFVCGPDFWLGQDITGKYYGMRQCIVEYDGFRRAIVLCAKGCVSDCGERHVVVRNKQARPFLANCDYE